MQSTLNSSLKCKKEATVMKLDLADLGSHCTKLHDYHNTKLLRAAFQMTQANLISKTAIEPNV
jgi:hypothetical protein